MLVLSLSLLLPLASPPDGPTTTLIGRVVDSAGAPAAGAEVLLTGPPTPDGVPIVDRAEADDEGRFALERPVGLAGEGDWRAVRLWAYRPGDRLASLPFPGPLPGIGEEVTLVLPPRRGAEFRVEGPDGLPIAGAQVRVLGLSPYSVAVPGELAAALQATTDGDGRATIDALGGEQVGRIDVEAEGLGSQPRSFAPPLAGTRRVILRPAGALEGRFVVEDGRPLRGWTVSATTRADNGTGGRAGPVPLAEDGSFRFRALAAGALDLWVRWPEGPDPESLPDWPQAMAVREGVVNRVEIPVRPAAEVSGAVRERGTGAPVPGVRLSLFRPGESSGAGTTTDAEGRFAYRSLPGRARISIGDVPPTHVRSPSVFRDEFDVPAPPGRVELPPVELLRAAPPLRGVVRGDDGAPVAGAVISGGWSLVEGDASLHATASAVSDAEGRFAIAGIAPDAPVSLSARQGTRATTGPVEAHGGQDAEVALTLVMGQAVAVAGRVVAADGTPLEGAAVRLNARAKRPGVGMAYDRRQLGFGGGPWLYTGPDGTFRTPDEPRVEGVEYQAQAEALGYLPAPSDWAPAGEAEVVRLPDIVLRRAAGERVVTGRVVGIDGAPIAGARVLQRGDGPRPTEATTDADGRFRLPGVAGGRALVVAEAPGFRLGGAIVGPEGPVAIRLHREGEAVPPPGRAAAPMARDEERALGLSLLGPIFEDSRTRSSVLVVGLPPPDAILARLDPDRAVAMLEGRVSADPTATLIGVALARFEDDPAEAVAALDADRSGSARQRGLLALADLAEAIDPGRRGELLDLAAAEARGLGPADAKLLLMGEVADRWLESLDLDRAAPILREGRGILEASDPSPFAHQVAPFGEALAAVDLPAAEAFLSRRAPGGSDDEGVRMRDRAALAVRATVSDPAAAERLARGLHYVPNFTETRAYLLRIARNMARADLPRARAVLGLLDRPPTPSSPGPGPLRPYGLALLAEARAGVDPDGARALLDEAFAGLRAEAESSAGRPTYPPAEAVMAELLPLVERLEPDRVRERLWLAVACRPARPEPIEAARVRDLLSLAALLARYDREVAAVIFEPAGARLAELVSQENGGGLFSYGGVGNPLELVAAYDPRALVALIEQLPESARRRRDDDLGRVVPSLEDRARLVGAEMLGMPPAARLLEATGTPFASWPVRGNPRFGRGWP